MNDIVEREESECSANPESQACHALQSELHDEYRKLKEDRDMKSCVLNKTMDGALIGAGIGAATGGGIVAGFGAGALAGYLYGSLVKCGK